MPQGLDHAGSKRRLIEKMTFKQRLGRGKGESCGNRKGRVFQAERAPRQKGAHSRLEAPRKAPCMAGAG